MYHYFILFVVFFVLYFIFRFAANNNARKCYQRYSSSSSSSNLETIPFILLSFYTYFFYDILFFHIWFHLPYKKVIVGSCVLLYVGLTAVHSYPQGYAGGGHDEEEHVDYYVRIHFVIKI